MNHVITIYIDVVIIYYSLSQPGEYLTGSFNLTSNMTLFVDYDATLLASTDFVWKTFGF